ncbi:polysialyltransferase family glycosyltransferase [Pseudomonas indica]|uniref:Uncharacterized protein n=1 Tax=Pseudomonas indica TaxID=137658 RepID=A0A1G8YR81_9PSED|nr:polysialyltransferase family glycosyltransferase [Pseudomonas indica]SDK05352.1 hypothetical protein SAMN05216186_10485 [Pseudomonas indica]
MRKASVIFVLGQAQNIILRQILERVDGTDVYLFTVYPPLAPVQGRVIGIRPVGLLNLVLMCLKVVFYCFRIRRYAEVDIYTPHLMNFVANKVYYSNVDRVSLYYLFDGILNYRRVSAFSGAMVDYQVKQRRKSVFIFHRYVRLMSDVVDQDVKGVRGMLVPQGVILDKLQFDGSVTTIGGDVGMVASGNGVLVLEPPMDAVTAKSFESRLYDMLLTHYRGRDILIKPHPSRAGSLMDLAKFKAAGFSVDVTSSVEPAEVFFFKSHCQTVVSTTSSALLMIKCLCPAAMAISLAGEGDFSDSAMKEVLGLMKDSGVLFL